MLLFHLFYVFPLPLPHMPMFRLCCGQRIHKSDVKMWAGEIARGCGVCMCAELFGQGVLTRITANTQHDCEIHMRRGKKGEYDVRDEKTDMGRESGMNFSMNSLYIIDTQHSGHAHKHTHTYTTHTHTHLHILTHTQPHIHTQKDNNCHTYVCVNYVLLTVLSINRLH
jgi:hypothetical protein